MEEDMARYIRSDELYHFGIKGQKWGVRRYQNEDGTYTEEGKLRRQREDDYKNRRHLSDAELDKRINRLKKEKEYKRLAEEDLHPGKHFVKTLFTEGGNKLAKTAVVGAIAFVGKKFADKFVPGLGGYMFPNPGKKK
jgi:hypothetical protein